MRRLWVPNLMRFGLLGLFATFLYALSADGQVPADAAAIVNRTPISRKAVQEIVSAVEAVQGEGERDRRSEEWERSALESLIDFELLYQEAKRVGVTVEREDVEKELERTQKKFGEQDKWRRALAERGWTFDDLRNDTERALVVQRFLETVVWRDVRVDPQQVEEFYAKNRDEFRHPDQVRVRHAMVPVQARTEKEWLEAERQADVVRRRWVAEASNSAGSSSGGTAEQGVDLGWVARGELDPAVENIVFRLGPGEVSEPVRLGNAVHVFFVTARRQAGVIPLNEARPKIEAVLRKRERQRLRDELVMRLRQQAEIRYP
ncbi:Foldase protein PrsA [bacterium HR30]|nr:Foldase protein PrsA [bacterium HR30]